MKLAANESYAGRLIDLSDYGYLDRTSAENIMILLTDYPED